MIIDSIFPNISPLYHQFVFILDMVLVYLMIYRILLWLKRTHAFDVIKGFCLILLIFLASHVLGFVTLNWVFSKFTTVLIILMIIIFQPELRRFLERIGASGELFSPFYSPQDTGQSTSVIRQIMRGTEQLAKEKIGGLIVIEQATNLSSYIETGIKIQGEITSDLLASVFWPGSPTHDGAAIIRQNKIEAVGCFLPLTETVIQDRRLGTRHRAALGLSEVSDALIIVISEESGVISLVENGIMTRYLNKEALETRLFTIFKEGKSSQDFSPSGSFRKKLMNWISPKKGT